LGLSPHSSTLGGLVSSFVKLLIFQNPLLDYLEPTTKHHDGLQPVAILIHL
uniref:Uncharacterized protein n=1 Tax=Triticum urartu TaxID=4572 RepID=A0A8R7TMC2_TRIUA